MDAVELLDIREGGLDDPRVVALAAAHHAGMAANTPACSMHALDVERLGDPAITVWSAWIGDAVAGIGALKAIDAERGELKSMRTADPFLGRGVARAILHRIMQAARERGMTSLWLETGSGDDFIPARRLYASEGFTECGPFDGYAEDPLSTFMTRSL